MAKFFVGFVCLFLAACMLFIELRTDEDMIIHFYAYMIIASIWLTAR